MNTLEPITPVLSTDAERPLVSRALQQARVVGHFAFVQVAVQVISFLSGVLLVRRLDQRQYAYFTVANSMQGTINILADVGISIGLVSIGGRIWHDRARFSELVVTALRLRRKLGLTAMAAVVPILYFLLVKNGASTIYAGLLVAIVVGGLLIQFATHVLLVVPRLLSEIRRLQIIDLVGAVARLALVIAFAFIFLDAVVAVATSAATFLLQYWILRSYVAKTIDLDANQNVEDRAAMHGLIRSQAANAIFYCFQGQITVFLISAFAHHARSVAEVGALGRLGMIFAVLGTVTANIFVPAFAKSGDRKKLAGQFAAVAVGVAVFGVAITALAALFPSAFLLVLGNRYTHLHRELVLMVAGSVIAALTATFWSLNTARAWVGLSWLYIPLTLATQLALIPFTDFSSVSGVLIFNVVSALPNLLLNFVMSFRGFHSMKTVHA